MNINNELLDSSAGSKEVLDSEANDEIDVNNETSVNNETNVNDSAQGTKMPVEKKINYLPEIVALAVFVLFSIFMFCVHELNHEEIQSYLLAKDSNFAALLFVLPHYQDVSPLYMILLAIVSKIGVPMEIALRLVSFPFALAGAGLVMFKAPFKRIFRLLIPFTFFLFYEYTVISSPYAILFAAFAGLAFFFKSKDEKPIPYLLSILALGMCGIYGVVFAVVICVLWVADINIKRKTETVSNKPECTGIDNEVKSTSGNRSVIMGIVALVILVFIALPLIPNKDSYYRMFTDHSHPLRNLIYTFFIMPADAVVTDVDFMGLLQNNSWSFVGLKSLALSSYFASVVILVSLFFVAFKHKKRRYFVLPFGAFAIVAALGSLYNYQIGAIIPFGIFLLWICLENEDDMRNLPKGLAKPDEKSKDLTDKIGIFATVICMGMSLIWTAFSCYNDMVNDVWYAKRLNQMIEEYHLTDYTIVSDWAKYRTEGGYLFLQEEEEVTQEFADENGGIAEEGKSSEENTADETDDNYIITYTIRQLFPQDYYQMPNRLNYADCVAYSKNGSNYIHNLNQGDGSKRFLSYEYASMEQTQQESLKLGQEGYPDIIIGDPNIVGLMGLEAEGVRYYLIGDIQMRESYKLYSIYKSGQMFIRSDLYMQRDSWPFMEWLQK